MTTLGINEMWSLPFYIAEILSRDAAPVCVRTKCSLTLTFHRNPTNKTIIYMLSVFYRISVKCVKDIRSSFSAQYCLKMTRYILYILPKYEHWYHIIRSFPQYFDTEKCWILFEVMVSWWHRDGCPWTWFTGTFNTLIFVFLWIEFNQQWCFFFYSIE